MIDVLTDEQYEMIVASSSDRTVLARHFGVCRDTIVVIQKNIVPRAALVGLDHDLLDTVCGQALAACRGR